jgi:hypothetical protein
MKDERRLQNLLNEQGDQAVLAPLSPHGRAMAFRSSAPCQGPATTGSWATSMPLVMIQSLLEKPV